MPDCIFCAIVAGELPAILIASDERAIAFMDINPATRGHALVIPRVHSQDIHEIAAEDLDATEPETGFAFEVRVYCSKLAVRWEVWRD